jgi:hypothetical protein
VIVFQQCFAKFRRLSGSLVQEEIVMLRCASLLPMLLFLGLTGCVVATTTPTPTTTTYVTPAPAATTTYVTPAPATVVTPMVPTATVIGTP